MGYPHGEENLTDKQRIFCVEYIKDWAAGPAAIRAGYSEKTSASIASTLLRKVNIRKEVKRLVDIELGAQKDQIRYMVVKKLKQIGLEESGVKHSDQIKACEVLGKYANIFNEEGEKLDITLTVMTPEERRKRLEELEAKRIK